MEILQAPKFKKTYKKLHTAEQKQVECAIAAVLNSPHIGERKIGDLMNLRVYKFRMNNQLTLLGYRLSDDEMTLELVAVGPHENFYRDLK